MMVLLKTQERAELAHELIKSLDAPADEGVREAWDQEIVRRISRIDSGQATLIDRNELQKMMRTRIGT